MRSNLKPLTYTKKEVDMIGDVSKMHLPREKRQLSYEEFLNWPPSVALTHIAAHGIKERKLVKLLWFQGKQNPLRKILHFHNGPYATCSATSTGESETFGAIEYSAQFITVGNEVTREVMPWIRGFSL